MFTYLHKIDAQKVRWAPQFREILPMLEQALQGWIVYQPSGFDRGAIATACSRLFLK
jgi:hypothetical protein